MIRSFVVAVVFAISMSAAIGAQQAGESVNVMPVWVPCDLAADPAMRDRSSVGDAWRYGDIFSSGRSKAVSLRHRSSNRILTGFIDYSAVDTFSDTGLGDTVLRMPGPASWASSQNVSVPAACGRYGEEEEERRPNVVCGGQRCLDSHDLVRPMVVRPRRLLHAGRAVGREPGRPVGPLLSDRERLVGSGCGGGAQRRLPRHLHGVQTRRDELDGSTGRFRDLNIPDEPARHGLTFLGFTTLPRQ